MASTAKDRPIIDWEAVGKIANLEEALPFIPLEQVVQVLGIDRIIAATETKKVVEALLKRFSREELQELLRSEEQKE
jgi:hypothetical protein